MRLRDNHFAIAFVILALITAAMLLGGCTTTREITTNVIDSLKVVRPKQKEIVPIQPVTPAKKPGVIRSVIMTIDSSGNTTATPVIDATQPQPRKWRGKTLKHEVEVDLDAGTTTVTDAADTLTGAYMRQEVKIEQPQPGFFESARKFLWPVAALLALAIIGYVVLTRKK